MELDKDFSLSGHGDTLMGAIFMSNITTKRECFKRHLFGLPSSQEGFVKKVKAGMILFLFEYEERKLHGVFEATSDGALNIVPQAFRSSGQSFPAQIRFRRIWSCYPLAEHEFCDAIKDNYYTHKKFNFCLSGEQVQELLGLFSASKIKTLQLRSFGRGKTSSPGPDKHYLGRVRLSGKDRFTYLDQNGHNAVEDVDSCGNTDFSGHRPSHSMYFRKPHLDTRGSVVDIEPMLHPSVLHDIDLPNLHFGISTSQDDCDVMGKVPARSPDDHPYYARVPGFWLGDSSSPARKPSLHSRDNADIHAPSFGNQLYQSHLYRESSNFPYTNHGSLGLSARPEDLKDLSFPYHEPPICSPPVLVSEGIKKVVDVINFKNHPSFTNHCEPPIRTIPSSKSIHSPCRSQLPAAPQYQKTLRGLEVCDQFSAPEDELYFKMITESSFSRSPKNFSEKAQRSCAKEYYDADYLPHQSDLRGLEYMHNGCDIFPPPEDEHFNKKITESFFLGSPQKNPSMQYIHNGYDIFPPPGDEHFNMKVTESSFLESPPKRLSTDQHGYVSESKDGGAREQLGPYHSARYYENFPTVENSNGHTDTFKRGTSVFSRLSKVPEVHSEEDETSVSGSDLTVNQLMGLLSKRKKYWHMVTKPMVTQEGNVSKSRITEIDNDQLKNIVLLGPGEAALEDKGVRCNEEEVAKEGRNSPFLNFKRRSELRKFGNENETTPSVEEVAEEGRKIPFLNFKRRSELRKFGNENETTPSVEEVAEEGRKIPFLNFKRRSELRKFGNENETTPSVESTECDGSLAKPKRRKLVRPSFLGVSLNGDNSEGKKRRKLVRPSFLGVSFNRENSEGKETQTASQELFGSQAMVGNVSAKEGVENVNVYIGNNNNEGGKSCNYNISASQEPLIEHTLLTASEYIGSVKWSSQPVFGQAEEAVANANVDSNLSSGKAKSDCQNLPSSFEQPFRGQLLLITDECKGGSTSSEAWATLIKDEGNENLGEPIIANTNIDKYAVEVEKLKNFRVGSFGSYKIESLEYKVPGICKSAVMTAEEGQGSGTSAFSELEVDRSNESIHNLEGGRKVGSSIVSLACLECEGNFSTEIGIEDSAMSAGNGEMSAPESDKNHAESSSFITYESERGCHNEASHVADHRTFDSPVIGKCGGQECDEVCRNAVLSESIDFIPLVVTRNN